LADLLAASIHLESELGVGSVFSLDIPVHLKVLDDDEAAGSNDVDA